MFGGSVFSTSCGCCSGTSGGTAAVVLVPQHCDCCSSHHGATAFCVNHAGIESLPRMCDDTAQTVCYEGVHVRGARLVLSESRRGVHDFSFREGPSAYPVVLHVRTGALGPLGGGGGGGERPNVQDDRIGGRTNVARLACQCHILASSRVLKLDGADCRRLQCEMKLYFCTYDEFCAVHFTDAIVRDGSARAIKRGGLFDLNTP